MYSRKKIFLIGLLYPWSLSAFVLRKFSHSLSAQICPLKSLGAKGDGVIKSGEFSWTQQWYPMQVEVSVDKSRPLKVQLLGNDIVLWYDGKKWNAFEDHGPHRGVPLSEGRIEKTGELLCAYHAWRFNSCGMCTKIPQCADSAEEARTFANTKSHALVYPVQVAQGLIWIWGESFAPGSDEAIISTLKRPRLVEQLHDPELKDRISPYTFSVRDLPYGE